MIQQTIQDNPNSEILNLATLSEGESVRTVVNGAIQVQIIRSDIGYIVDVLDRDGELIETDTVFDDDLENTKTMTTQDTIKHILDIGMLLQDNTISKEHHKQLASIVRDMGKSLTLAEVQGQDLAKILALADITLSSK